MTNKKNQNTIIIGVGNPMRSDDGIGVRVIEKYRANDSSAAIINGGTDALNLIDSIKQYPKAIIIDAVRMNTEPGTIKVFSPKDAKIIQNDSLSTHGLGLAEMLVFLKELDIKTKITIIGIEPEDISYGDVLSATIEQQIPTVINLIKKHVNS
ncbi:MAG: hydrogenase maturation protease [Gammaproteobacteria bacterium]|nr:hydrogenase maturation protease [Gammaproteobacteria bacterium]